MNRRLVFRIPTLLAIVLFLLYSPVGQTAQAAQPHEIAAQSLPAVVMILTEDCEGEPLAYGSAFRIVPGLFVTNAHVIEGGCKATAKLHQRDGQQDVRRVAWLNQERDLALLEIDDPGGPVLQMAGQAVQIGQTVFAVGNPMGLEGTFSVGNVSALRDIEGLDYIQITAPISPGSSGGPVLDNAGRVVGVATAQLKLGQNLNFAIPARHLQPLLAAAAKQPPNSVASGEASGKASGKQPATEPLHTSQNGKTIGKWFARAKPKSNITLRGDTRTMTYFWPWCRGFDAIPAAARRAYSSRSQAEAGGFRPSPACDHIRTQ